MDQEFVKVFRMIARDIDREYWATDDYQMTDTRRVALIHQSWGIEVDHRDLKPCWRIERAQVRTRRAVRRHLSLAMWAFVRQEVNRWRTSSRWCQVKVASAYKAIRSYPTAR